MYRITSIVCSLKHVEYILDLDAMMIGRQSWCNHKSLLSFFLMAAMLSKLIMVGEIRLSALLVRSQQELRVYKMVASMRKLYTLI